MYGRLRLPLYSPLQRIHLAKSKKSRPARPTPPRVRLVCQLFANEFDGTVFSQWWFAQGLLRKAFCLCPHGKQAKDLRPSSLPDRIRRILPCPQSLPPYRLYVNAGRFLDSTGRLLAHPHHLVSPQSSASSPGLQPILIIRRPLKRPVRNSLPSFASSLRRCQRSGAHRLLGKRVSRTWWSTIFPQSRKRLWRCRPHRCG